jgi:hypothetical protein
MVGHTVVELLVAATVTLLVFGAVLAAVVPASDGFTTIPEHADAQQRLRALVETIREDVWASGGGAPAGPAGRTGQAWPAILPCGWGQDPVTGVRGRCARDDTFSIVRTTHPLWAVTAGAVETGDSFVQLRRPPGCVTGATGCEFVAGEPVMLADGFGRAEVAEASAIGPAGESLGLEEPLSGAYSAGAILSSGFVRTYYVRADPSTGSPQLRRRDHGSDQPSLDNLGAFSIEYFGVAEPPVLHLDDDGTLSPSYGPAPKPAAGPATGAYAGSCGFAVVEGQPVTAMQRLVATSDGLARVPLAVLRDGPWCPDDTSPSAVDLDTFRIRLMRVTVRMQAPAPWLRGQDPFGFAQPGSGRAAGRLVPDVVAVFDLAVRGAGR